MVQLKIITLLLVVSLADQQRIVGCDEMETRLESVQRMLVDLEQSFDENVRANFLDQVGREDQNYPLVALAAEVEVSEAILYAFQRRGLLIAEEIISEYFIKGTIPLNEVLQPNQFLVDLIIQSSITQSIKKGLLMTENYREKIYLLSQVYESHPGIMDLSHMYSWNIKRIMEKEARARKEFEDSLTMYRGNSPFLWSSDYSSAALNAINEMIWQTEQSVDLREGVHMMNEEQLLTKYALKLRLLKSIRGAREEGRSKVDVIDIHSVDIGDFRLFEENAAHEYEVIRNYLDRLDARLVEMDQIYRADMQVLLYQPQQLKEVEDARPLRAVSAIAAEAEALMYSDERRMLLIAKELLNQHSSLFFRTHATNEKLFGLLEESLMINALAATLSTNLFSTKKICKLSNTYKTRVGVTDLVREYFLRLRRRRNKLETLKKSVQKSKEDALVGLLSEMRPIIACLVDDIVQKGIEMWLDKSKLSSWYKLEFDEVTCSDIMSARKDTYNWIEKTPNQLINSIEQSVVDSLEERLLGKQIDVVILE